MNTIISNTIKVTIGIGIVIMAYGAGAGGLTPDIGLFDFNPAQASVEPSDTTTVDGQLTITGTESSEEATIVENGFIDAVDEISGGLNNFSNHDVLEEWVMKEYVETKAYFSNSNMVVDCDDYAFEFQRKALEQGYIISFDIISIEEYNKLFSIPLPEKQTLHAINLAIVGNCVYYIEPQTGEIVQAAYLD